MKNYQILFEHLGEYSYTEKQPVALWESGMVDMAALTTHTILSSDDWRPCPVARYEVREIELPDWLSPERWLARCDYVRWHFVWHSHKDAKSWPEPWQICLFNHPDRERRAIAKLLGTKNFRSDFRYSLRQQLERWIETPEEKREFVSPFSDKQWQCLVKFTK